MNVMPSRDVFERDTHIIVGGTSQTGGNQTKLLQDLDVNIISTGSGAMVSKLGINDDEIVDDTGLRLKDKSQIEGCIHGVSEKSKTTYGPIRANQHTVPYGKRDISTEILSPRELGITDVVGDVIAFGERGINVTLHAMSMQGVSHTYPQEVVQAIEDANGKVNGVIYISYEDGYGPENTGGSHVYYPVRNIKQKMEESTLESCENAKILDLITFDSPSAKAIGFTFLGIVGDFVNFLEAHPDNYITQKYQSLVKEFLGEDYQGIIDLFGQYPLRGELQESKLHKFFKGSPIITDTLSKIGVKKPQQSMKQMAQQGTLNRMISGASKKINFAKFSRISGSITDLYLYLAMNDLNTNREEILASKNSRVLLNWNRVGKQDTPEMREKIDGYFDHFTEISNPHLSPEGPENGLYRETETGEGYKNFEFDIKNLDFLSNHFGILPFFMSLEMVKNSGLLQEGECIKVGDPNSKIFTYNKITMRRTQTRKGKPAIEMINTDNPKEVFCVFELGNTSEQEQECPPSKKYFSIPKNEREKSIDEGSFPHSVDWGKTFLNTIPDSFQGIEFSRSSALVEHLGFQLANLLLNNPNSKYLEQIQELFSNMKKFDRKLLQGIFGRMAIEYEDPNLDKILETGIDPEVRIVASNFRAEKSGVVNLNIKVETLDDTGKVIGRHRFMLS